MNVLNQQNKFRLKEKKSKEIRNSFELQIYQEIQILINNKQVNF
ncbi:hypothetical protein pb186bvf_012328 [Paramecium bursaria]